nr:extensin family protein [Methylopila sp. M107]
MGFHRRRTAWIALASAVVFASVGALAQSAPPPLPPTRDAPVSAPVRPQAPTAPLPPRREPPEARTPGAPLPPIRPTVASEAAPRQTVPLPPVAASPAPPRVPSATPANVPLPPVAADRAAPGTPADAAAAPAVPARTANVPLPPIRPAPPAATTQPPAPPEPERSAALIPRAPLSNPAQPPAPAPPTASPLPRGAHAADPECRSLASEGLAVFETKPAFGSAAGCGASAPVELTAIRRRDGGLVKLEPPATLRCGMARAVTAYVRDDLAPAAAAGGVTIDQVDVAASYDCRGRNRVRGAKLSEHGKANAFDIRGFGLADGRDFGVYSRSLPAQMRAVLMPAACSRFSTVLGPGSDGYHEDHLHMDLQQRRRAGSKTCRWRGA